MTYVLWPVASHKCFSFKNAFSVVTVGLCPDWESWVPEKALPNCTEAMDAAERWLDVPQVSSESMRVLETLYTVISRNSPIQQLYHPRITPLVLRGVCWQYLSLFLLEANETE